MKDLIILDDEPALRLLLKEYFKSSFNVVVLEDGNSLLKFLIKQDTLPSVIIVDLAMPDMSGLDVIKEIRGNSYYDSLAIIVLSGKTESRERVECLNAGADDFMIKPFNPEELRARIQAILRRINRSL